MRNQTLVKKTSGKWNRAMEMGWQGYESARMFQPWPGRWYERLARIDQINFEIGRLYAVNVRAAGFTPPPWVYGKSDDMRDLFHAANALVGRSTPPINGVRG